MYNILDRAWLILLAAKGKITNISVSVYIICINMKTCFFFREDDIEKDVWDNFLVFNS